jgi:HK97 family phage prohead protease
VNISAAPPPTLRIAGYAALFGVPDGAGDIIRPGAFTRTLADRGDALPLYWQHRPEQRIGTVQRAEEDARGLRVIARIDNPRSRAVSALLAREVNGLSFGYRALGYRRTPQSRLLEEIELIEVSVVTHPLQPGARIHLIA